MKLTTITLEEHAVPAALLTSGSIVDLTAASRAGLLGQAPLRTMTDILDLDGALFVSTRGLVDRLETGEPGLFDQLKSIGALHDVESASFAPILKPGLIVACGMAYKEHMHEMNVPIPSKPTAFMKSPNAIVAHKMPIVLPAADPDMVDYECEFACVIGRPTYDVTPEEAMSCVAGFTMVNDVGSRTNVAAWLAAMEGSDPRAAVGLFTATVLDKQLPGFCPMGPVIETADSFGDPADFLIETRLNGELVQSAASSDLIFPIAYSLSYFSRWYKFLPGDVLSTGSPAGVGFARTPPRMLRAGDVVEVSCPKIGTLSNHVIAARPR